MVKITSLLIKLKCDVCLISNNELFITHMETNVGFKIRVYQKIMCFSPVTVT